MSGPAHVPQPAVDLERHRRQQRDTWDELASEWESWQEFFERGAMTVTDWMLAAASLSPEDRLLDLGTGVGEPALTVVERQPEVSVTGVDQSPQMIAAARRRAGTRPVVLAVADVDALPFDAASFEIVLSRFGLMLAGDLPLAFRSLRRVLVPGGRLVLANWIDPPSAPVIALGFGVAAQLIELPPPPAGAPGPFSLGDPADVDRLLADAGFVLRRSEEVETCFQARSMDEWLRYAWATLPGWLRRGVEEKSSPGAFRASLADASERFTSADGLSFTARVRCVVATVPSDKLG